MEDMITVMVVIGFILTAPTWGRWVDKIWEYQDNKGK